jgi:hypothetical protein
MDAQFVTLTDALKVMRQTDKNGNPIPFSICWCTADKSRKTGGELKRLNKAYMSGAEIRRVGQMEEGERRSKRQNHFGNATRNIKDPEGNLKKVHIYLILELNGMTVL